MCNCKLIFLLLFLFCTDKICFAQAKTDSVLQNILFNGQGRILQDVLHHKDSFRVQIIYTRIDRDENNHPLFQNYYFNTDTGLYFNPASTVKLPLALLSLEKLNRLNKTDVNKYTSLQIDSNYSWQTPVYRDSSSETGFPSIAHYIKKAFLVSDNDAYNRMYQFVGQQAINDSLHSKGYTSARITRQFLGLSAEENRFTNSFRFTDNHGRVMYTQPPAHNPDSFYFGKPVKMGRAYYNARDSLINEPIDFTRANNLPLEYLQQILQSVMFPESVPGKQRFNLTNNDYRFLYQYLSQYPSETNYPKYDSGEYYNSYVKFFFRGSHQVPSYIRVFNKVGWAYGFLIDVSYVADFKNQIEYMLTATIYVNSDGILNDDKYDYDETGWPFMEELGQTIYQYELKRTRKYKPDLKKFEIRYEQRNANDNRPLIKNVDN
jgi:Beta-lactamase enzyme family